MRVVLIILAIIGGLFVASIFGCVACISAVVVMANQSVPEHFTKQEISAEYAGPIRALAEVLAANGSASYPAQTFDDAVVAIFPDDDDEVGSSLGDDIYGRHAIDHGGHSLWNGAGAFFLTVDGIDQTCAAYTIRAHGKSWVIALRDWQPAAKTAPETEAIEPAE